MPHKDGPNPALRGCLEAKLLAVAEAADSVLLEFSAESPFSLREKAGVRGRVGIAHQNSQANANTEELVAQCPPYKGPQPLSASPSPPSRARAGRS